MTGFESKRQAAQAKLDDDADTLSIVYQRGFADGKRAAQPEQEPVSGCACRWDHEDNRVVTCERHQGWLDVIEEWADRAREAEAKLKAAPEQPEQEPVAWVDGSSEWKDWCGRWFGPDADDDYLAKAVFDLPPMAQKFRYTALEQPEQRKPLTDDEINGIAKNYALTNPTTPLHFARAIEAAHNIKEGT
jgi:hypothetical protein